MGEQVAAALIQELVGSVIKISATEISRVRRLKKNAQELNNIVQTVQEFLNDAETTRTIPGEALKRWLRRLQDAAFDADNVLDEINYHHLSNQIKTTESESERKMAGLLRGFFTSIYHCPRNRRLALRIEEINKELKAIYEQATGLGLTTKLANAPALPRVSKETDSFSTVDFVGRAEEEAKLVSMLNDAVVEGEEAFSVHAIWGMGGMGKTTLVRRVFHHQRTKARFGESRVWVHVSQDFDPLILFKKILEKLTSSPVGVETKEVILDKIQEALKDKTYLLVLDDVWNEDIDKWGDFISSLSGATSTKRNCILVTTRIEKVASTVRPVVPPHQLQGLSDNECWSIIKSRAFDKGDDPSLFETVGLNIAKNCHGLPLAANLVGGRLYKASPETWMSVEQNLLSRDEKQIISEILRLSFDNLSMPSLKKCFAYCSIFPKGHELYKQNLVDLWMAEWFLQPDDQNTDIESVGEDFFNVLLQNSLLIAAWRDGQGDVGSCVMHDLVHDLASSALTSSDNQVRYLICDDGDSSPVPEETAKYLRTYLIYNNYYYISDAMFLSFKSLRNLTLGSNELEELPSSIRTLIHLRNLIIMSRKIGLLPDWIGELHYLQTIHAMLSEVLRLPSTLKYLTNLRRLGIQNHIELPPEIGRLKNLENLCRFDVQDKEGYRIDELGSLNNLKGELIICNLEEVRGKEEAEKARLSEKPKLLELWLQWAGGREGEMNDESVMEGLRPHSNLRKLRIEGYKGKRFATWTLTLNNVREIVLNNFHGCDEIPTMGHLPHLKSIDLWHLSNVTSIGYSFYGIDKCKGASSFPSLESISLSYMPELREWEQVEFPQPLSQMIKVFPCLRYMSIYCCEKLESLPSRLFGNKHDLREIKIENCSALRDLPEGIQCLTALEHLFIKDCPNLKAMQHPSTGGGGSLTSLRRLTITNCQELTTLVEAWVPTLEYLHLVELRSLKNLSTFIDCLARSPHLQEMKIAGLPEFMSGGCIKVWPFNKLQKLEMDVVSRERSGERSAAAIMETVDGMLRECCHSLTELTLTGLEIWECLPESIQHLIAVKVLKLKNFGVEELPEWLGNLSSLRRLDVHEFRKLKHLPSKDAMQRPAQIRAFYIRSCPKLRIDDSEWDKMSHIRTVNIDGRRFIR